MNEELLKKIEMLAGAQRALTFRAAAEFILTNEPDIIIETGCYRGIPEDGQSTLILAMLSDYTVANMHTYDISQDSIDRAKKLVKSPLIACLPEFHLGDSVTLLSQYDEDSIGFAYLDSFDHDPNNPGPCQRHELAEIGAIYGKMLPPCAILLDDCVPGTGGKALLGAQFLKDRGWKLAAEGYQLLFVKEE